VAAVGAEEGRNPRYYALRRRRRQGQHDRELVLQRQRLRVRLPELLLLR